MKKLDKIILAIFSAIIFLESVLTICLILNWLKLGVAIELVERILIGEKSSKVVLGVAIVCILLAIKGIFFDSSSNEKNKAGVLMKNDNGKLLISKSTIENIVETVVKDFESVTDVSVGIDFDDSNNLIINVNLVVEKDVIIKELTLNMQNKIKEAIKKTSDLDVKEVNVRIKNIAMEKESKK